MIRSAVLLTFCFWVMSCASTTDNTHPLKSILEQIVSDKEALVGVSLIGNSGKDNFSLHGDKPFPMQSVYKFHISLVVLSEIDKGNLTPDQEIKVNENELLPGLWSPLREDFPEGGSFTIARLIQYAVSHSDNVACDVLIRLIGSPKKIEAYFKELHIKDISITYTEEVMQAEWENMFLNWTTPDAATQVLKMFYENKNDLLSQESHAFIWKTMKETDTGKMRLKGQLPEGTVVAHKTGWSGTHKETGITDAVNDVGIVFLPNGEYFIISVFVTASKENIETNERIIAEIAKATYDYYTSLSR